MPPHVALTIPPPPAPNAPPPMRIPLWQQDGPGPGEAPTCRHGPALPAPLHCPFALEAGTGCIPHGPKSCAGALIDRYERSRARMYLRTALPPNHPPTHPRPAAPATTCGLMASPSCYLPPPLHDRSGTRLMLDALAYHYRLYTTLCNALAVLAVLLLAAVLACACRGASAGVTSAIAGIGSKAIFMCWLISTMSTGKRMQELREGVPPRAVRGQVGALQLHAFVT